MARSRRYGTSPTRTSSLLRHCALLLDSPRDPASVPGIEALLDNAERDVHAGAHVFDADLIRQFDHTGVAEPASQVGDLLVGDGMGIGAHRVGVGDRGTLVVGVARRGR